GRDHPRLDAADEPLVLAGDAQRVLQVDAALRDDIRESRESRLADVQERNDLGVAPGNDVAGESFERRCTRAAGIDDGGDAGLDAPEIGVDAVPREPVEDVRVEVDQTGSDEPTTHRDGPRGLCDGNVRPDARDDSVLDSDIQDAVEPGGRIHHCPTLEQEIVHVIPPRGVPYQNRMSCEHSKSARSRRTLTAILCKLIASVCSGIVMPDARPLMLN